jgi:hypothetical protein
LSFADHGHRYCPIHNQIEDVFDVLETAAEIPPYDAVTENASSTGKHIPCSVLNADTVGESLIARSEHCRQRFEDGFCAKKRGAICPPSWVDVILVAPKNSPPAVDS